MRILLLALDTKPEEDAAEGIHVRELAENLASLGHQIALCVSRDSSWTDGHGNKMLRVRPVGGGRPFGELLRVLNEARRFDPQVVYERRFLPRVSACVSLLRNIPSFVEINGLVDEEIPLQGRFQRNLMPESLRTMLYSAAFGRMAKVVTVTRNLGQEMRARYRIPENRIAVVENGANSVPAVGQGRVSSPCRRRPRLLLDLLRRGSLPLAWGRDAGESAWIHSKPKAGC